MGDVVQFPAAELFLTATVTLSCTAPGCRVLVFEEPPTLSPVAPGMYVGTCPACSGRATRPIPPDTSTI